MGSGEFDKRNTQSDGLTITETQISYIYKLAKDVTGKITVSRDDPLDLDLTPEDENTIQYSAYDLEDVSNPYQAPSNILK